LIKGTTNQEEIENCFVKKKQKEIAIANIYRQNDGVPNFIIQTLLDIKSQIDPTTITNH
jgi:hypothetical protein